MDDSVPAGGDVRGRMTGDAPQEQQDERSEAPSGTATENTFPDDDVEGHGFKIEGFDGPVTTARLASFHQQSATVPNPGGSQRGKA